MFYKIIRITDLDSKDKTDEKSIGRIGRIMHIDPVNVEYGKPLYMDCIYPGLHKSMITSHVQSILMFEDGMVLTTDNSIYHLELEKEEEENNG